MKTVSVSIAEKEYTITPKCIVENRKWREKLIKPVQAIHHIIENADNIKLDNVVDVKQLIDLVLDSVAGAPDVILGLICDYSPGIAADREYIEANGYDEEIMGAFKEVIKLVYPFGTLVSFIKRRG